MEQSKEKQSPVCGKIKSERTKKTIVLEVENQMLVHELDVSALDRGSRGRLWIPHLRPHFTASCDSFLVCTTFAVSNSSPRQIRCVPSAVIKE
jgi:hypothetical protein